MPTEVHAVSGPGMTGFIGLSTTMIDAKRTDPDHRSAPSAGEIAFTQAENRDLRVEVDRLRAECDRLRDLQQRVMELVGAQSPDRIIHDLRNILNERALFKALADTMEA